MSSSAAAGNSASDFSVGWSERSFATTVALPPRNCRVGDHFHSRRLEPSCASHSRHSRRPSMATGRPFERYCACSLLVAPDGDVEVVRLLGPLARGAVLAPRVDGEAEAAHGSAARRVAARGSLVRFPTSTTRLILAKATPLRPSLRLPRHRRRAQRTARAPRSRRAPALLRRCGRGRRVARWRITPSVIFRRGRSRPAPPARTKVIRW